MHLKHSLIVIAATLSLSACEGDLGPAGAQGEQGGQGPQGPQGPTGPAAPDSRTELQLPGDNFFPEGITHTPDGSLFVGSFTTGQVWRFTPGATRPTAFVTTGLRNVVGLLADAQRGLLWVCDSDFTFATAARVKSFDLATGAERGTYPLPGGGFCNDLTLDAGGNLYVTDSVNSRIDRLAANGTELQVWSENDAYKGGPNEFTLNGIAFDGQGALYVAHYAHSALFRVAIQENGAAAAPVALTVTPAIQSPDGIQRLDANTFVVVEGNGRLTRLAISGNSATAKTLSNRLDSPTTVALSGDTAWVVEGQLGVLIGSEPGPADLPFRVRRVYLP
ncbi:hypothetical protein [Myxococcus sp. RHSTA-1-4]|uniref:Vgb family protein n=1 Tax=Myxococcus sp. RHSTA-1-4 TaxID=2874601 RepID=UPI001CC08914|nr:hypothetical protein [Myxococcus sp. RHSTA-1-4]MBZ4421548.1 hypothetical protein [Myxococcus sp. RHSTA-1-4]